MLNHVYCQAEIGGMTPNLVAAVDHTLHSGRLHDPVVHLKAIALEELQQVVQVQVQHL